MKDKVYLDSNTLVSYVIKDHSFYNKALKLFEDIYDLELYISLLSFDEFLYSLTKYKIPTSEKKRFVKIIVNVKNLNLIENIQNNCSLKDYSNVYFNSSLKPRDALHLYLMRINDIKKIATFDEDFIEKQKELSIEVV